MRKAFEIDIEEIGKYYHITEDGLIYSHVKKMWLNHILIITSMCILLNLWIP